MKKLYLFWGEVTEYVLLSFSRNYEDFSDQSERNVLSFSAQSAGTGENSVSGPDRYLTHSPLASDERAHDPASHCARGDAPDSVSQSENYSAGVLYA